MNSTPQRFGHAVVIGGSMAGLAAARVLSETFQTVTILERGPLPEGSAARKAVPQARHVHVLLEAAVRLLRGWFPGIIEAMLADGANLIDVASETAWYHCGGWKPRFQGHIETVLCSRGLVEQHVRRCVTALPNVTIRYDVAADQLTTDPARTRATGVLVKGPQGDETLPADLVVDAAGRGTRAPRWLKELGLGTPPEERVGIDLAYTTGMFEPPPGHAVDWKFLVVYSRAPEHWRSGFVCTVEQGQWQVSLNGYFGDHAPLDLPGFLDFARSLPRPHLYDALRDARLLGPLVIHKIPESRWFHYEKMARSLERYVLLGDSVCAFNPIYGQGMTVAFLGARLLGRELATASRLDGFARPFQNKLAAAVAPPWLLSTTMDLAYPRAQGKRPPGLAALQSVFANLIDLTSTNSDVCRAFYDVLHMRTGMERLARPGVLLPLLAQGVKSLYVPLAERVNGGDLPPAPRGGG